MGSKLYSKIKPRKKAVNIKKKELIKTRSQFEEKRYLQKFCFFFPDLFLSRVFTKKMSIQNQKNVKILKNLLMYDKKNHLSPTPNNNKNNPKKKKNPPQKKKKKTPPPKKKKKKKKK